MSEVKDGVFLGSPDTYANGKIMKHKAGRAAYIVESDYNVREVTFAGQLYGEFKEFFPENAVEYFVS